MWHVRRIMIHNSSQWQHWVWRGQTWWRHVSSCVALHTLCLILISLTTQCLWGLFRLCLRQISLVILVILLLQKQEYLESTDLGSTGCRIISKVVHPLSDSIMLALTSKFRPYIGQLCDFFYEFIVHLITLCQLWRLYWQMKITLIVPNC